MCRWLYAWIIEHGELDWKHAFMRLNVGFAGSDVKSVHKSILEGCMQCFTAQVWVYLGLRSKICHFGHTLVQDRSNGTKGEPESIVCVTLASFPGVLTPAFVTCSTSALVLQATNAEVRRPGMRLVVSEFQGCMHFAQT